MNDILIVMAFVGFASEVLLGFVVAVGRVNTIKEVFETEILFALMFTVACHSSMREYVFDKGYFAYLALVFLSVVVFCNLGGWLALLYAKYTQREKAEICEE